MKRKANIGDVARRAGFSTMTVSRYINKSGYVGDASAEKIQQAIMELKYRPNQIAKSLQSSKSMNIAVLLGNVSSPMSAWSIRGIESVTYKNQYNLLVCNTEFSPEKEKGYVDMLLRKQIDGIIMGPCSEDVSHIQDILDRQVPLVFISRGIKGMNIDFVSFDIENAAFQLVNHLAEQGNKKIAILSRDVDLLREAPHYKGYRRALEKAALLLNDEMIFHCCPSVSNGYKIMELILSMRRPPEALFVTTNVLTAGVLQCCIDQGVRIPEDLMLVSFDSFGDFDGIIHPHLTCNKLPAFDLGVETGKIVIDRIKELEEGTKRKPPIIKYLPGTLLLRESTSLIRH